MFSKVLFIFGALFAQSVLSQFNPQASLYANTNCGGSFISLPTNSYTPDLSVYGFNNYAFSVRLRGAYLFYDLINFNPSNAAMEYVFEPNSDVCVNFNSISGFISSVRFAGSPNDYRSDSITFYASIFFQAEEEYVISDTSNLQLFGKMSSLIVTGQSSWTVYDRPSYQGNAICLTPQATPDYEPAFVPDTVNLNPSVPHGSIASVRKGCFSSKVVQMSPGVAGLHSNNIQGKPEKSD